ncbi:MAG: methyltransferase [Proteobacteria bacterium]|nr:MAG: methyltransferase [Pseudomonadota bacterium]
MTQAGSWSLQRTPEMEEALFKQWQAMLEDRIGLSLPVHRKVFLQTNLYARMREIGCASYREYLDKVRFGKAGMIEWLTLVDRLTVQETRFYRDPDAMGMVRRYVLDRPKALLETHPLAVWSVGCSSGEEAYSLAMVLNECVKELGIVNYFGVTGTDISKPALKKARQGRYPPGKLVTLDDELKEKYFTAHKKESLYQIRQEIKKRVCFARVNILELDLAPLGGMDIIYCQNVLIYFRKSRRKEILTQLAKKLEPGGLLVLGLGEIVDFNLPGLERIKNDKVLAFKRKL